MYVELPGSVNHLQTSTFLDPPPQLVGDVMAINITLLIIDILFIFYELKYLLN
jgi:hypothetical protein